ECIHDSLFGSIAPVAVKVYGDDLTAVDQAAKDIAGLLAEVPGSESARAEAQTGQPELVIRGRPHDAARYGLRSGQILDAVHAAYQGAEVGQTYDRNRVIDLVVILDPAIRNDPDKVADLWISVPGASVSTEDGPRPTVPSSSVAEDPGRVQLKRV